MRRPLAPLGVIVLALDLSLPVGAGQAAPSTPSVAAPIAQIDYPDSTSGLEHLANDILKAQKENDSARTDLLLNRLILPHPQEWYERVFGPIIANNEGGLYQRAAATVPAGLAKSFLDAAQLHPDSVQAQLYDRSCDDNAGEFTFGILHARVDPAPLYEIRFRKGTKLMRLSYFAFVDGPFRYVLTPKLSGPVSAPTGRVATDPQAPDSKGQSEEVERIHAVGGMS